MTLIISSIIALLVIAGAAMSTGKLMRLCEENAKSLEELNKRTEEAKRFMKEIEDKTNEMVMDRLLLEVNEILNQKQS
jgi:uncharacterized protein with GYD domain